MQHKNPLRLLIVTKKSLNSWIPIMYVFKVVLIVQFVTHFYYKAHILFLILLKIENFKQTMKIGPPDMHYKILGESFVVFGYNQNSGVGCSFIACTKLFQIQHTCVSMCTFDEKYKKSIQIYTNSCTNQHATLYSLFVAVLLYYQM